MFKNYFISAIRNLRMNKAFSIINIMGLTLGLMCSLFIWLWVRNERNMDHFNAHTSQLYNVYERVFTGGKIDAQRWTPGIMAEEMKRVFPQVQYACGFTTEKWWSDNTFQSGNKILNVDGGFAGKDFFLMFRYPLIEGSATDALNDPSDIVISRKMADNFFGSPQNAINKTIRMNNKTSLRVSAVYEIPDNTSQKFDYLINWYVFLEQHPNMKSWDNTGVNTYIMLKPGANPEKFRKEIPHFLNKYAQFNGDYHAELGLQRFDNMYLYSHFNSEGYPDGGRIEYVRLFSLVAIFILIIACINFMNLTTARSSKRAKEIGVRKVMGAYRLSLVVQFMGEAIMLAVISMILAVAIVALLLPAFDYLIQKQISLPVNNAFFWCGIILISLLTGILAGSYPALFLSSFKPVKVLKSKMKSGTGNVLLRKGLVVFQFVLSIVLIIGTILISKQVNYIETKNLGYNRENLLYIKQTGNINTQYQLFKNEALKMAGIQSVSWINQMPANMEFATWGVSWEGMDPSFKPTFSYAAVGYDFTRTMHIQVLEGHVFSKNYATDSVGYILNETAAKETGYKDPIGKPFTLWGKQATIIGLIKDFNFNSLHSKVKPMVLYMGESEPGGTILVRTQPGKTKEALLSLQKVWKQMNPAFPFSYQFADVAYEQLYQSEQMVGNLSHYFAVLAIFISCLGLLGLVMFMAEQRTKEIGIRKVMGATSFTIASLLSKDFLKLVLIAIVIASPIAWWAMNKWLQSYAYHTAVSWWIFAIAAAGAILIALVTVSFQAIKAAVANPVDSLRTE